ncbi:MAG: pilus assembly PilX N-terminal domain-containing protein [Sedimentisphaerales bacterium]|nr:pilus assembly PilX N-terminal domain-containing protein [Sedimentisphaerales bacterium]
MAPIAKRLKKLDRRGAVLIISMIFVLIFSTLAVSFVTMSGTNAQLASNQHKVNSTLSAAQSGLECGRFILATFQPSISSNSGQVTQAQADATWNLLCSHVQTQQLDGQVVPNAVNFTDSIGSGDEIIIPQINYDSTNVSFQLRFYRYDSDPNTIMMQSIGTDGMIARKLSIDLVIKKDTSVLNYAVASKSRVIITGDSTIDGDIYSTWDKPGIAPPFEMENTSIVNGTLNTVVDEDNFDISEPNYVGYTLEGDKVTGTHKGINYGQPNPTTPGFDYTDYDTSSYAAMTTTLPASGTTVKEYFPHDPNDYTQAVNSSSSQVNRQVYDGQTFTDRRLPAGRNSLFKNCTFEGIFYIGIGGNGSNNIRFEDCQFNGVIVTGVPNDFKWKKNMLYFTGSALFNNTVMQEATILAPNFNVNLGNTQTLLSQSESVLTGLIVGGIVDVRGNANIDGTILSMYDPGPLGNVASQYGTNVGFSDENSEAGIPGDIGTIYIHPDPGRMLPVGISSDVIIVPLPESYTEE